MRQSKILWTRRTVTGFVAMATVLTLGRAGATSLIKAIFDGKGPAGITGISSGNGPFAGAIKAVVPHPTDPDVVWVGTVNGGVWKTSNATSGSPTWTPLTDHMASLSTGALELDPTFASPNVLVAGIGNWSSYQKGTGGPLTGILRTTDGGATWSALGADDLSGENVSGVAPRGNVIVVASKDGKGGIWRSTNTGATFSRVSSSSCTPSDSTSCLPSGLAYDLAGDPSNVDRLYTAIRGSNGGVYRSDDAGATWHWLGGGTFGGAASSNLATDAKNMKVSVHANDATGTNVVYAAVVATSSGQLAGVFRSANRGDDWKSLDLPQTTYQGTDYGLHPGGQGGTHLSLVADPTDPERLYLGGDRRPQGDGAGRLFRCDAGKAAGSQCTEFTGSDTSDGSAPHPDSRDMQFDANQDLLETDDGGIYRRTKPDVAGGGKWSSMNGNLTIAEAHSCAYDNVADVILCGTQDNGEPGQATSGDVEWEELLPYDGGIAAAVGDGLLSTRYYSTKNLSQLTRTTCVIGPICVSSSPALIVDGGAALQTGSNGTLPLYTPMAGHASDPMRLIIADTAVYESKDGGESLTTLDGFTGTATRAIAYGTAGNPGVLYVGSSTGLFVRSDGGEPLSLSAYSGGAPVSVAIDPQDGASAWVVDDDTVWHTTNAGDTWTDVTGDLADAGAARLFSIAFIPGSAASIVAVGADNGLYATNTAQLGRWGKLTGALPNVVAYDLRYDSTDDLLLIATLGRGAWTIPSAREMNLPPVVNAGPDATASEGAVFSRAGSFSDPGGSAQTHTATVDYGDGPAATPLPLANDGTFTLSHVYADDGTYTVTVEVSDDEGARGSDTLTVTVTNVAPTVGTFTVSPSPAALGTVVNALATFTDPGALDTHTATIDWNDGSGAAAATIGGSNTSGTASGSHLYAGPGVYTVSITVTDKDGGKGQATYQYAVVYDPDGGFVTGGGWISSPPGAWLANPSLTGKADFGFAARYHKGQSIPDGNTRFQFHAGGFDFKSTAYEWLVVAGPKAQFKGTGTVNGGGAYGFMLSAVDGNLKATPSADTFRIKVWDTTSGAVVYDNQRGDSETATPTTTLGGGSIVIHP